MGIVSIDYNFFSGPFQLSGQLDCPNTGKDPYPSLLLVPGTAQHDRSGKARGFPGYNEYYSQIAHIVTKEDYNIFRYDKGGVGKSKGGLSFSSDMVSAYRTMLKDTMVDKSKIGLIVHGGGSAHVFRRWGELNRINSISHLILLGTGVNELKLRELSIPILVILGDDAADKSLRAIEQYAIIKNVRAEVATIANVDKNLFDASKGKPNLLKEETCKLHPNVAIILANWLLNVDSEMRK